MSLLYDIFSYDNDVDDILTYFDVTYVNGPYKLINNTQVMCFKRRPSMFAPYMWNVHNATKLGYSRTNNISEGWNNKFQHLIRFKHPHIYIFIEALQMMNSITTMEILKLNTGIQINCKIKSNEERLKHICKTSQFKTNTEIISFLKNVSYVIKH